MAIQAIERAAAILRELDGGRSLRLNELCERLGLAKGTTHGLLKALQLEGLVAQERASGRYQLGPGLLLLGRSYLNVSDAAHDIRGDVELSVVSSSSKQPVEAKTLFTGSTTITIPAHADSESTAFFAPMAASGRRRRPGWLPRDAVQEG